MVLILFAYMVSIPQPDDKSKRGAKGCGVLVQPEDTAGIMLDIAPNSRGLTSIELLDPLCPACRAQPGRAGYTGVLCL